MQRRYSLAHFILVGVVALGLTPLMVVIDAQAQIAFSSNMDGNWEIYVMSINGKNQRRLTNNRHDDWSPSWSPDGKRIVLSSERDGNREIYVMAVISEDSPIIPSLTIHPHGHPMVNVLPSVHVGMGTGKST